MTVKISLRTAPPDTLPVTGVTVSHDNEADLSLIKLATLKATDIVVICGAGISVDAGIPDFRSSSGLFRDIQSRHSGIGSGKNLFNASVFHDPSRKQAYYQLMGKLSSDAHNATPTYFHHLLRKWDGLGRLRRVYTQNIDRLEEKVGLSFDHTYSSGPHQPSSRARCIPLHGDLSTLRCTTNSHIFPSVDYTQSMMNGEIPECPQCNTDAQDRLAHGKRARGRTSELRPNVILYDEVHPDEESLGKFIEDDLREISRCRNPCILLVVGTSLQIPGTKKLVRDVSSMLKQGNMSTSLSSGQPIQTICVNLDFPTPNQRWVGVFDTWVCGDLQEFASMVLEDMGEDVSTYKHIDINIVNKSSSIISQPQVVLSANAARNTPLGRGEKRGTSITESPPESISADSSATVSGQGNNHTSSEPLPLPEESISDGNPYDVIDRYIQTLDIFPDTAANNDLVQSFQDTLLFDAHTSMKIQVTDFFKTHFQRLPTLVEIEQFSSVVFQ